MKKYCVIGARGGSKGIIDKNIQLINGKSLLRIAAEKAIKTNIFDEIFISSDKASYASEIPDEKNIKFVLRPKEISGDTSTEQEYLMHVIEDNNLETDATISRMQCTSPFQSISSIVSAVHLLSKNSNTYDSIQLVTEASPSIYKALIIDNDCLHHIRIRFSWAIKQAGPSKNILPIKLLRYKNQEYYFWKFVRKS